MRLRWYQPMERENPQTLLLRTAAFLVDALALLVLMITPATALCYLFVVVWNSLGSVARIWHTSFGLLVIGMLLRDGYRGRSPGKRLFGLRIDTPDGEPCGWGRSVLRNLPLVVPGWNLVEVALVFFTYRSIRTGDRLARTRVVQE